MKLSEDSLRTQIIHLRKEIFSDDLEVSKLALDKLAKIGGNEIVDFLISLLDLNDPWIRNRAALALEEIKDNRALEPLFKTIFKKENHSNNGTLVFALKSMDCSKKLKDIFKILFYETYESKISADSILSGQIFDFTKRDILEIQELWEDCIRHPEKCPGIDNEQTKLLMQESVNGFTSYLDLDCQT